MISATKLGCAVLGSVRIGVARLGVIGAGVVGLLPPLFDSITQWLKGNTDGETLTDDLAIVTPEPDVGNVPYVLFNGTDERVLLDEPFDLTGDFSFTVKGKFYATATYQWLVSDYSGNNAIALNYGGSTSGVRIGGVIHYLNQGDTGGRAVLVNGEWHVLQVSRTGNVISFETEGRAWYTTDTSATGASIPAQQYLMDSGGGKELDADIAYFDLSSIDGAPYFPCQETNGDRLIDAAGNLLPNHGTIVTANDASLTVMRAGRSDVLASHNLDIGCEKFTDDVEITQYYNDAVMAVTVRLDDLRNDQGIASEHWTHFFDNAALCSEHHIVSVSCAIMNLMNDSDFDWGAELTAQMIADPLHLFNVHSWSHSTSWTDTEAERQLEYVASKEKFLAETSLTLPDTHRYNGSNYLTSFMQWGGNMYDNGVDAPYSWPDSEEEHDSLNEMMAEAGYLQNHAARAWDVAHPKVYRTKWDSDNGIYFAVHGTSLNTRIIDGSTDYEADFDAAYAAGGYYAVYCHPARNDDWSEDTDTAAFWEAWADYVGDKTDVWYTDPDSQINYHYLRSVGRPVISYEEDTDVIVSVEIEHSHRVKYGLSTPVTYKIKKPTAWGTDAATAWYRDTVDTTWVEMTDKTGATGNDRFFTGINCFRNDGADLIVSQGFPQTSDSFEIKIVKD